MRNKPLGPCAVIWWWFHKYWTAAMSANTVRGPNAQQDQDASTRWQSRTEFGGEVGHRGAHPPHQHIEAKRKKMRENRRERNRQRERESGRGNDRRELVLPICTIRTASIHLRTNSMTTDYFHWTFVKRWLSKQNPFGNHAASWNVGSMAVVGIKDHDRLIRHK